MGKITKARIRSHVIICATALGLVFGFAARGDAATYTFTKIAETSSVPDGFSRLGIPSINDDGTVAFSARQLKSGGSEVIGIFTGDGTTTKTIVDTSGPSSNFGFSFTNLGSPSINKTGVIAFWAILDDRSNAFFTSDGTTAMTIAGPFTNFFGTNPSINDAGTVAYRAVGIFTGNGGSGTTIADTNTTVPGTSDRFTSFSGNPAVNNGTTVVFHGSYSGGSGIFTNDGTGTTIASTNMSVPGTGNLFTFFSANPAVNNGGTAVFEGFFSGGRGIFTSDGTTAMTIADTTSSSPFSFFFSSPAINNGATVAFNAIRLGTSGIFTGPNSDDKVISAGDFLGGVAVTGLGFSREGLNNAGQVAFVASFPDFSQAIYRADPEGAGDPVPPDPAPLPNPAPSPDPSSEMEVLIDIKPGNKQNTINPGSNGVVVVAILGSAEFDALTVNPESLELSGAYVMERGKGTLMARYKDVNGDGYLDLVVHVETQSLSLAESTTTTSTTTTGSTTKAVLTGETWGGRPITGSDSVNAVP
ncbi:MAG: choice-of-anchor tandem repeat NxxGxxAF-containing protein [Candidatus Methylomirabilales bacterium]